MDQIVERLTLETRGPGLLEITRAVSDRVAGTGFATGLATIYCQHTSASLLIQENADLAVRRDLDAFFARLVPEGMNYITHTAEGSDDMPAHIKAALTQSSLAIPVVEGRLALGTWQGIYLFEHRRAPHRRTLLVHVMGA